MSSKEKMDGYLKKVDKYLEMGEDAILNADLKNKQNGSSGREGEKSGTFWIFTWLLAVVLFILFTFVIENGWFSTILFGIASLILFVPAVYFGFAKNNICFTIVNEGTAKIITTGGAVVDVLLQYKDHVMDREYNISVEKGVVQPSFFGLGGLRFYGIWPFYQIYTYDFSWTSVDQNGEKKEHINKQLDHIMIKDMIYWLDVKKAEDSDLLPLNLKGFTIIRIINPYKALFGHQNWYKITIALIQILLRGEVAEEKYEDLITGGGLLGSKIMKNLNTVSLLKKLEDNYGVQILKIEIKNIDPPENFRVLTMKKFIAEQKKTAKVIAAGAEAERIKMVYSAIESQGDAGRLVRTLEMLEKSENKWIISSDILNAVKNLFDSTPKSH